MKPIEVIVSKGVHPHPGPRHGPFMRLNKKTRPQEVKVSAGGEAAPAKQDENTEVTFETISVTHLAMNKEAIMARGADIIGLQAHKLRI